MTTLGRAKRIVNRLLEPAGHVIAHASAVPSFDRFAALLAKADLMPRTVIDVGVAYGTPWLYAAFPNAKFHLIDPTREALPFMNEWAAKLDADVHNVALGSETGTLRIRVRGTIEHATLLADVTSPEIVDDYEVKVERFDSLLNFMKRPVLCKIDVEGAEMMVLQGIGRKWDQIDAIILETSMNSLYSNGPEFGEVVSFFDSHSFAFYDFIGVKRRPYDEALHQLDAVFVPTISSLRIKKWS